MKKLNMGLLAFVFAITMIFAADVSAQETMMKKVGNATVNTTKKVYKKGKRVGHTVGSKTWNGSKWVASKTVNGTKWVYRKAKRPFVGAPKRNM
ncbi:MAG: hypothetical protein ABL952_03255 [Pyrinomonadaceae bacterium]